MNELRKEEGSIIFEEEEILKESVGFFFRISFLGQNPGRPYTLKKKRNPLSVVTEPRSKRMVSVLSKSWRLAVKYNETAPLS